ncbi:unnamed protein product [Dovyalis caffra]|uniref:Uncharacterized protein n=1 Tax=Dovyalis caffra TaxID=77055 RepID=A0AAV1RTW8_9ROSI|nr:unnamed protein product [Dovyalis caffra]
MFSLVCFKNKIDLVPRQGVISNRDIGSDAVNGSDTPLKERFKAGVYLARTCDALVLLLTSRIGSNFI